MAGFFPHRFRLRPIILTLFVALTVPVLATIVAVTYLTNDATVRSNTVELAERFRVDAIENIKDDIEPIKSLVHSAAVIGGQEPVILSDDRTLEYLFSILAHSEQIVSVYIALEDGSFRQARRVDPTVQVQGKLPPGGTRYAYRWVMARAGGAVMDRYLFLDAQRKQLGAYEEPTGYDPRQRGWYRYTVGARDTHITDPDIFSALGLIGITVAAPIVSEGKTLGVAAIDITLEGLSEFLAARKLSRGTQSYILDFQGRVIANSDLARTYVNEAGRLELLHVTSLDNELPAVAFGHYRRGEERPFFFMHDGREYFASLTSMPRQFGKRWQLFLIAPFDDFTGTMHKHNERLLLFALAVIAVQVLAIYLLSGVISAPLERLAQKVWRLQEFGGDSQPSRPSMVREISALGRAVDTLDNAIKSFAAFVPVGLVRQLLDSERKLELGGHSRFLTIFFSDLESFSTLSEQTPTQELLLRVSAYLEVVTKAVNAELGTIDKFVGDGVMAFWGAPAILEDHAWRACVAALRVRAGMAALNARWRENGLPPLRVRMGIHSDAVLVGNIGSRERMSYTVLGDGVNVAARLEGLNKELGTSICISHNVFKEAGERLCVRPIDEVTVKGRRSQVPIYELLGAFGAEPELEPGPGEVRLAELGRLAYEARMSEDKALAAHRYRALLGEFPDDSVSLELMRRIAS